MKLRLLVLALGSLLSFGSLSQTTNYPNRTVRIVVPFAAAVLAILARGYWRRSSPRSGASRL